MKEPQWDDSIDDSKEIFDAGVILSDEDTSEAEEEPIKAEAPKTHITELRRRIEERLDSKRIDHEFDYDDFDGLLDKMS